MLSRRFWNLRPGAATPTLSFTTGLILQLDASQLTGGTDGGAVSTWNDVSGAGNDFTQATGSKQPTFRTNQINRLPAVSFDGGDLLTAANFDSSAEGTLAIVTRMETNLSIDAYLFSSSDEASTNRFLGLRANSSEQFAVSQNDAGTVDAIRSTSSILTAGFVIVTLWSDGASYAIYKNGTAESLTVISGTNSGDWFGDTSARDNFTLGGLKRTTESNFWTGEVAEALLYSAGLSAANLSTVHTYLGSKYGISLA